MKTAQQYAERFYDIQANRYDSIQDLTQMFQEYAREVGQQVLEDAAENVYLKDTQEYIDCNLGYQWVKVVDKDSITNTEIKTP